MDKSIKNGDLEIVVKSKGAELVSVKYKNEEFMWNKEEVWAKSSPLLFPFVGKLLNDKYIYNGKEYHLDLRHGFARDLDFAFESISENSFAFVLKSDEQTKKIYPFDFSLKLIYEINLNTVKITYEVENLEKDEMYFSIGAHPAFVINGDYEKSYIKLDNKVALNTYTLDGPYLSGNRKLLFESDIIQIKDEYFENDALVFDGNITKTSTLHNDNRKVKVCHEGFEYIAYWRPVKAPFVCIEPWFGITDSIKCDNKLENKKGIRKLLGKEKFSASLLIAFEK